MSHPSLFAPRLAPVPSSIDLRCCDVAELLASGDAQGATLCIADPPWGEYEQRPGVADPELTYPVLPMSAIAAHVEAAYDVAAPGARLALWTVWPLMLDWLVASSSMRWRYVTGGAWAKQDSQGAGYHWLGRSEPVLVYHRPGAACYTDRASDLGNSHVSSRTRHSEKPIAWQRLWIRRWTRPGELVVDLYAGRATVALACLAEGRRYLGAEIDPQRHADACGLVAGRVGL